MNDHELARKLARETGSLLLGLRTHAATISHSSDSAQSALAEEILGSEGDRVAHDYLVEQFAIHRPRDVFLQCRKSVVALTHYFRRNLIGEVGCGGSGAR